MLGKENLIVMEQLQALEKFNIANENRISYGSLLQTKSWCEPKLNARKDKKHNVIIAKNRWHM
jgi:hypothetical protein